MPVSSRKPRRYLRLLKIHHPVPMVLVVPVDPTGELPPAAPVLGLVRCRCRLCAGADRPRWVKIPPLFLGRLLNRCPGHQAAIDLFLERFPWLERPGWSAVPQAASS
ncbi:MAG: hypothetical protein HY815_15215 [Candidatus Riflebacteria bacterium]|nr:hypothetical protein [Candidatus Riflebacteria bacterium]